MRKAEAGPFDAEFDILTHFANGERQTDDESSNCWTNYSTRMFTGIGVRSPFPSSRRVVRERWREMCRLRADLDDLFTIGRRTLPPPEEFASPNHRLRRETILDGYALADDHRRFLGQEPYDPDSTRWIG